MKKLLMYSGAGALFVIIGFATLLYTIQANMGSMDLFFMTSFMLPLLVSLGVSFISAKKAPLSLKGLLIGVMAATIAYIIYYPAQIIFGNLEMVKSFMQGLADSSTDSSLTLQQASGFSEHFQSFITGLIFVSFLGSIGGWLGEKQKNKKTIH